MLSQLNIPIPSQAITTGLIVLGVLILKAFLNRWIDSLNGLEVVSKRRMKTSIKTALWTILAIAIIFIWAPSLRTFALSIAAFSVAIIIATKELILCLTGYTFKITGQIAKIGSRIELAKVKGEVIDQSVLTTTLAELEGKNGKYTFTGKKIIIPNSTFHSEFIKTLPSATDYIINEFSIYIPSDAEVLNLKHKIDLKIIELTTPFEVEANKFKGKHEARYGILLTAQNATSSIGFHENGKVEISIRLLAQETMASAIEDQVCQLVCVHISTINAAKKTQKESE